LTYNYDANGNRVKRTDINSTVTNYGWDQANRLTSAGTSAYAYNGDGVRMSKTVPGTAEAYVWNVVGALPTVMSDGSTAYVTDASGLPIEQITGSTVYYYLHDQLGSTRVLYAASGISAATYTYDAYGTASVTGSVNNPFQFAGQYADGDSGFVYMRARYYDPGSGQFVSRDPADAFSREAYVYVADNPLNGTDPNGLLCWEFWDSSKCNNTLTHVETWATTPEDVPNPGFITGSANGGLGAFKMLSGAALLLAGTVADVTVVGIPLGLPTQVFGAYQVGTGAFKTYKGYKQFCRAQDHPIVRETPIEYFKEVALGLSPGPVDNIADRFGGLP